MLFQRLLLRMQEGGVAALSMGSLLSMWEKERLWRRRRSKGNRWISGASQQHRTSEWLENLIFYFFFANNVIFESGLVLMVLEIKG